MHLPSIVISSGNAQTRLAKAKEISLNALVVAPTSVEEVREIKKFVSLGQSVILCEAQNLTAFAQNALLKTLEEPPENVQIFLLTPDPELLLPTVVSRCQIVELPVAIPVVLEKDLEKVLDWVGKSDIKNGFAWSGEIASNREHALETIDQLLVLSHQNPKFLSLSRKFFLAKKYLQTNTNVRLTLENLFLN